MILGLLIHVWDLCGLLPRNEMAVGGLIDFLTEINWAIDTVHPELFTSQNAEL
ncbi:hypothetical protein PDIG_60200 [Penicillium digitatum PHI26]|uniref:Uncharacterized protein n=2 Tax=Penicillium digitatum TaxID=36651 RepID=K9FKL0_PEND2|nr:hypothetical protein PDIP_69600 [Penicillium digitatum Pd1]EKV08145.1 hypothetical protein PDIP_69600 [Penicillium digitatum Pd1]EKV09779.1 hypothetical protein PDIG_60200 [Penicillium digitatum PHI26]